MKGWFDAFRTEGGPTLYSYSNRTPVTGDLPTITLYIIFFTLFIAFLIIFPGVRKERFTTFISVTLSLFVGTVILVTNKGSCWHVSEAWIRSDYRSFSTEKIEGKLGVYIGLQHVNVTLESTSDGLIRDPRSNYLYYYQNSNANHTGISSSGSSSSSYSNHGNPVIIDYNERFHWDQPEQISQELTEALYKGLPYPILTVLEYFSLDDEGFSWGRMYRLAGYYSSILLWASFASWLLMNLLLIVVPRYGAYQMMITSGLMLSADLIYYLLLPEHPLQIHFEGIILEFEFGWSFWMVAIAGTLCGVVGLIIALVDLMYPNTFSTILEVDYDTPYDRHIIIEESFRGKTKARSLEDPIDSGIGLGRKILRTLSSKRSNANEKGLVNGGFEMDPPKSPWANYNRIMSHQKRINEMGNNSLISAMAKNPNLARLAAPNHLILNNGTPNGGSMDGGHVTHGTKTTKSVSFRRQSRLEQTFVSCAIDKLFSLEKYIDLQGSYSPNFYQGQGPPGRPGMPRMNVLPEGRDLKKRDDSDDESISNCSSRSEDEPKERSPPHFQAGSGDILSTRNSLDDSGSYPKPRLIPRVSYDSHRAHSSSNSNSRRGSNESSGAHSSSSISEFSSHSFDLTSGLGGRGTPPEQQQNSRKDSGGSSNQDYAYISTTRNNKTNNIGENSNNHNIKVNDEW